MKAKYNKKLKEKLFFRLDFSETVGWGHLKRCISISKALSENFEVYFIISDNDKLALDLIEKMNISVIKIKQSHKYGSEVDYYPVDLKHIILDLSHVENLKTPEKFLRYVEILYQKKINLILN